MVEKCLSKFLQLASFELSVLKPSYYMSKTWQETNKQKKNQQQK